jgi:hypothetical protein
MAATPQNRSPEVEALIRRIEASRAGLGGQIVGVRQKLDVPARIKGAVQGKPWMWFGGSLGLGFVASQILRRPRKTKKKGKWLAFAMTTGFALLKPMIRQVITNELQRRLMPPADPNQSGFPLSKR